MGVAVVILEISDFWVESIVDTKGGKNLETNYR